MRVVLHLGAVALLVLWAVLGDRGLLAGALACIAWQAGAANAAAELATKAALTAAAKAARR
jgi:hypothetical protein